MTLRTETANGEEVTLAEYICDMPGCPNVAEHVLGVVRELAAFAVVCSLHKQLLDEKHKR